MIPLRDNLEGREKPLVTWTLIALNVFLFWWDREWSWAGHSIVFADLAMRPSEIVRALGGGGDPFEVGKVFTSMFLHANVWHLLGNMLFLLVFGENVENALGALRYAVYYLFWGVVAAAAHIFVHPSSPIPTLGASGAIGGVLGCYFLLFPGNRVMVVVPPLVFLVFALPAWVLLAFWFVFQVAMPQTGVANWAHAGGFLAGMVTVLVAGGRSRLLKGARFQRVALEADND
jgi:membrane associated rhomboid family serine protease